MYEIWAEYVAGEGDYYILAIEDDYEMAQAIISSFLAVTGAHAFWKKVRDD